MFKDKILSIITVTLTVLLAGCSSSAFEVLNPFAENPEVELGKRDNKALLEQGTESNQAEQARHALEVMGNYRSAQAPEPYYPVLQPAEVRLMWVPDHLNKSGDLVPAHYYYLKILSDRWAVQDAFELEKQLGDESGSGDSATPWVYGNKK